MVGCSIVVCTYNRLNYLKDCIESLLGLTYPFFEIIIVNDGSCDGTLEFLNSCNWKERNHKERMALIKLAKELYPDEDEYEEDEYEED